MSLKDSFYVGSKKTIPSSVYFTWHFKNKLVSYSYSIFNDENANILQNKIISFLNGQKENFEIWLPDFSLNKYIHLNLKKKFIQNNPSCNLNNTTKEHFWQFILNNNSINGFIENMNIPEKISSKEYASLGYFHDVPLKNKLKRTQTNRIEFDNAQVGLAHQLGQLCSLKA